MTTHTPQNNHDEKKIEEHTKNILKHTIKTDVVDLDGIERELKQYAEHYHQQQLEKDKNYLNELCGMRVRESNLVPNNEIWIGNGEDWLKLNAHDVFNNLQALNELEP